MQNNGFGISNEGNLTFGGADLKKLAEEFKTPLYVFDEQVFRTACRDFKHSLNEFYGGNGMVLYASKAFACKESFRIIKEEGLGADTVSGGEIYTALKADFPPENIFFHGNNKSDDEIELAVKNKIGRIVIDDYSEIERISAFSKKYGIRQKVLLRIKPGIDAHTHNFIRTGQVDSKFGFLLDGGEAIDAVNAVINDEWLHYSGIHCHIGSQIFETDPFCETAEVMCNFISEIKKFCKTDTEELDLGGGFGIRYTDEDDPLPYGLFLEKVSSALKSCCKTLRIKVPKIFIEPGRSIAGPAGITLYAVGNIKTIPDIRTYVSIDGGMCDNPRFALYGAKYDVEIVNRINESKNFLATVAGKCCESGDIITENAIMQTPKIGDIMAVIATGAYNYTMASNYNRIPRPAVVMINNGKPRVIIKRETYDDIINNDI